MWTYVAASKAGFIFVNAFRASSPIGCLVDVNILRYEVSRSSFIRSESLIDRFFYDLVVLVLSVRPMG